MVEANNNTAAPPATGSAQGPPPATGGGAAPLAATYPVDRLVELTLAPSGASIRGRVYCTDEFSQTIALRRALAHTTLSSEVTLINAAAVLEKKDVPDGDGDGGGGGGGGTAGGNGTAGAGGARNAALPRVSKKALEEREQRAIKLAKESLRHINQRASPEGQKVFDTLLRACHDVVWKGDAILVLGEIRVDPPYTAERCSRVREGLAGFDEDGLERIKKIVAAASVAAASAAAASARS